MSRKNTLNLYYTHMRWNYNSVLGIMHNRTLKNKSIMPQFDQTFLYHSMKTSTFFLAIWLHRLLQTFLHYYYSFLILYGLVLWFFLLFGETTGLVYSDSLTSFFARLELFQIAQCSGAGAGGSVKRTLDEAGLGAEDSPTLTPYLRSRITQETQGVVLSPVIAIQTSPEPNSLTLAGEPSDSSSEQSIRSSICANSSDVVSAEASSTISDEVFESLDQLETTREEENEHLGPLPSSIVLEHFKNLGSKFSTAIQSIEQKHRLFLESKEQLNSQIIRASSFESELLYMKLMECQHKNSSILAEIILNYSKLLKSDGLDGSFIASLPKLDKVVPELIYKDQLDTILEESEELHSFQGNVSATTKLLFFDKSYGSVFTQDEVREKLKWDVDRMLRGDFELKFLTDSQTKITEANNDLARTYGSIPNSVFLQDSSNLPPSPSTCAEINNIPGIDESYRRTPFRNRPLFTPPSSPE